MGSALAWILTLEVLGLAFLPLTTWLFRWLPDRGFVFAKVLGLLLITYVAWLVGMVLPIGGTPLLPGLVVLGGASGWIWLGRATLVSLRGPIRIIAIEQVLFWGGFAIWAVLRVHIFGSAISHTEQYMDMSFLQASLRSASYPPYDPWMSGHTINYYYFGYMMFAMVLKLSDVVPAIGYNLALCTLFGLTVAGTFSLGYTLTRRVAWALAAPIFVTVVGNLHAALWQVSHSVCSGAAAPGFWSWLWDSTRVIGGHFTLRDWSCASMSLPHYATINEYPLFSFVLGDLHPHVMALPVSLLAIASGCNFLFAPGAPVLRDRSSQLRLLLTALVTGSLYIINSWDFPTYLFVVVLCLGTNAYITDQSPSWWKAPALCIAGLCAGSVLLFSPFYLGFKSIAHGIGLVHTPSDPFEFIQVFGLPLLLVVLLVWTLGALIRPAEEDEELLEEEEVGAPETTRHPGFEQVRGGGTLGSVLLVSAAIAAGLLGALFHIWTLLALLLLGGYVVILLRRVANTEVPNRADVAALVLIAIGALVLALTEVVYLRDAFDGSDMYRMNSVFKFYYQAWMLLGIAGAYAVYRARTVLGELFGRGVLAAALGVVLTVTLAAGIYTKLIPTYSVDATAGPTLDGSATVRNSHPNDYNVILWLRAHTRGNPTVLEGIDMAHSDYSYNARISTFTGLPTVIGQPGHEGQWRPGDPEIGQRLAAIKTIYTTPDERIAIRLLRHYNVRYVIVGDQERVAYGNNAPGFATLSRFMHVAYRSGTDTIYRW